MYGHMIKADQFVDMTLETLEERIRTQEMEGKIINKKLHDVDSFKSVRKTFLKQPLKHT